MSEHASMSKHASYAWRMRVCALIQSQNKARPRSINTLEQIGASLSIDMRYPVVGSIARGLSYRHMANEAHWILSGFNDLKTIRKYAKRYDDFSDDNLTLSGAYGPPFVDQLSYVAQLLYLDPHTRQAVISLWRPRPYVSKDIPCTCTMQFLRRDNTMHCVVFMRSSDAWLGLPYDIFCFTMMARYAALCVNRDSRDRFFKNMGTLTIHIGSSHLYEKDLSAASLAMEDSRDREFQAMCLYSNDSPDNLLDQLDHLANDPKRPINDPFFESIRSVMTI